VRVAGSNPVVRSTQESPGHGGARGRIRPFVAQHRAPRTCRVPLQNRGPDSGRASLPWSCKARLRNTRSNAILPAARPVPISSISDGLIEPGVCPDRSGLRRSSVVLVIDRTVFAPRHTMRSKRQAPSKCAQTFIDGDTGRRRPETHPPTSRSSCSRRIDRRPHRDPTPIAGRPSPRRRPLDPDRDWHFVCFLVTRCVARNTGWCLQARASPTGTSGACSTFLKHCRI
jgi:hypothetical protein